jgi:hypothetical protein
LELLGTLEGGFRKFFFDNYGQVPLCCYIMKFKGEERTPIIKCDFALKFMEMEEFKEFCLACQEHIRNQLIS